MDEETFIKTCEQFGILKTSDVIKMLGQGAKNLYGGIVQKGYRKQVGNQLMAPGARGTVGRADSVLHNFAPNAVGQGSLVDKAKNYFSNLTPDQKLGLGAAGVAAGGYAMGRMSNNGQNQQWPQR